MDLNKKVYLFVNDFAEEPEEKYLAIYEETSEKNKDVGLFFAYIHSVINFYANDFNNRIGSRFNAGDSRDYLRIIHRLQSFKEMVNGTEYDFCVDKNYEEVLKAAEPYLKSSWGSDLPLDLPKFIIKEYDPVFFLLEDGKIRKKNKKSFKLSAVGDGSYANVYKYKDEDYNEKFAYKKLKKGSTDKEVERFKQEYEIMKKCQHPNLLRVYRFFEKELSYNMEYCEHTLYEYISANNTKITQATRKSLLNQFFSGIAYIHNIGLFHRDLSYKNILIKLDAYGNPFVKISDFGLVKDITKEMTSSDSSNKGTFRDPFLESFKDYGFKNEIYAISYIVTFILYGRQAPKKTDKIYPVIERCMSPNLDARYSSLSELKYDLYSYL